MKVISDAQLVGSRKADAVEGDLPPHWGQQASVEFTSPTTTIRRGIRLGGERLEGRHHPAALHRMGSRSRAEGMVRHVRGLRRLLNHVADEIGARLGHSHNIDVASSPQI